MHAAVVALSELHEAVFADHMTRTFGVSWEAARWAATGTRMGDHRRAGELVAEFSTRARHIDAETDRLIAEYVAARTTTIDTSDDPQTASPGHACYPA